jgi:predicted metal-dependent hydrolase
MMWWNSKRSQPEIETQEITFRQWSVVVERKARRRGVTISLKPDAPIKVKAAKNTPLSVIKHFLLAKEEWIEKHLQKFAEERARHPLKKIEHEETFPFLGRNLRLQFQPTHLKNVFFTKNEKFLYMHLPDSLWDFDEDQLQSFYPMLQKFYRSEAEKLIRERIALWSETTQLFPKTLKFRNPNTRWGSCSSQKVITISWRLIAAPLEIVDYVLIHELCHLKYMNHSDKFWALVESFCPDYLKAEEWLKKHHAGLDFLARNAKNQ